MSQSIDRLYELLPAIYRSRDAELVTEGDVDESTASPPLRELLRVIAEQVNLVEDDITQLYENLFIETCEPWVVPYIGDLIGYRPVYQYRASEDVRSPRAQARERIVIPRRDVADTIAYRRRKGTASLLPDLARSVSGWPAISVETYRLLAATQSMQHVRLDRGRTRDLRDGRSMNRVDGPFDDSAYTVDVRRSVSTRTRGRHNIPDVAVFVWRLRTDSVTYKAACCVEGVGPQSFTFDVLGHDTPLFTLAQPAGPGVAPELTVPDRITRRAFEERVMKNGRLERTQASADYYGEGKSITIWAHDWPKKGDRGPIPREAIIPADLSEWGPPPPRNRVAVDPVLGRIVFPANQWPKSGVRVTYHDAFSADIGGGEYQRPLSEPRGSHIYQVGADRPLKTIRAALEAWAKDKEARKAQSEPFVLSAVIEIVDNGVYTEPLNITVEAGETLQLRAANRKFPVIRLLDYMADRPDAFSITATGKGARVVLDGLLIAGRGLQIYGPDRDGECETNADLCEVMVRHSTLVPGWMLECDCEPKRPNEPSVELINTRTTLRIEHSIVGTLLVVADEVREEPGRIVVTDSIVDATSCDRVAVGSANGPAAHIVFHVERSTVLGRTCVHVIELAENTIFQGETFVAHRQIGCMRFCYVPPGSRTPKRFHCEPDTAIAAALDEQKRRAEEANPPVAVTLEEKAALTERTAHRVEPEFNGSRYGSPRYCQLAITCDPAVTAGADDESEMGVFHDLYQPQRAANLRARLDEYTPAHMEAGVFFAT
ncbi:hypothetical protein LVJ94_24740 [Pendulispora rubella]|uniref:Uncharacterized protein n=1 Tax=Pendulispora rubella TaxID=2741070 RepID=A0ABZ2LNE8_9BACT